MTVVRFREALEAFSRTPSACAAIDGSSMGRCLSQGLSSMLVAPVLILLLAAFAAFALWPREQTSSSNN
eukprot:15476334-Alexandrium_andersonii.AAC.1